MRRVVNASESRALDLRPLTLHFSTYRVAFPVGTKEKLQDPTEERLFTVARG
jgi:hypothetical protein